MNYLGQLYHPHLVKLLGYCLEDEHRLLVYEFMPRGSLENHLFRSIFPILSSIHFMIYQVYSLPLSLFSSFFDRPSLQS